MTSIESVTLLIIKYLYDKNKCLHAYIIHLENKCFNIELGTAYIELFT